MKKLVIFFLPVFIILGCAKSEPLPQIDKSKYQFVDNIRELNANLGGGYVYNNPDDYWVIEAIVGKGYQKKDDLKRPIEGIYCYMAEKGTSHEYFDYPSKYKVKEGINKIYFHGKEGIYYHADLIEESK